MECGMCEQPQLLPGDVINPITPGKTQKHAGKKDKESSWVTVERFLSHGGELSSTSILAPLVARAFQNFLNHSAIFQKEILGAGQGAGDVENEQGGKNGREDLKAQKLTHRFLLL